MAEVSHPMVVCEYAWKRDPVWVPFQCQLTARKQRPTPSRFVTTYDVTNTRSGARRTRRGRLAIALAALALAAPLPAGAVIQSDFERGTGPALTICYRLPDPAAMQVGQGYLAGMRSHHAGAFTMSQDYLADPASSSPLLRQLARAIIVNQQFEMLLLDAVGINLARPPMSLPFGIQLQPRATEDVAQALLFRREPIPGLASGEAMGPFSERDVQFALAMTVHPQGALEMARSCHANPSARNGFFGLFNIDVIVGEAAEIALKDLIVAAYPGDAGAVRVDPSMIRGMAGLGAHGAHNAPGVEPVAAGPHAGHSHAVDTHARHVGSTAAQAETPLLVEQPSKTRRPPMAPRRPGDTRPKPMPTME